MQRSSVRVSIAHGGLIQHRHFLKIVSVQQQHSIIRVSLVQLVPVVGYWLLTIAVFGVDHNFYWMYPAPSEESSHLSGCPMVMNRVQQADYQWQLVQGVQLTPVQNSRQHVFQAAQKWLTNQFSSATWQSAPVTREFSLPSSLSIRQDSSDSWVYIQQATFSLPTSDSWVHCLRQLPVCPHVTHESSTEGGLSISVSY